MRLAGRLFSFLAIGAAIAVLPSNSPAYVLTGQSWPSGTTVTLQLSLGSPGHTLQDGSTNWNNAVAPAAEMWNSNILRAHFSSVFNSSLPCSSGDHVNSVVFAANVFGQSFGANTLAVTYYRYFGSTLSEADILFNAAKSFDSYRGPLQFGPLVVDIRRVFLHELGHSIGLDHPDTAGQQVVAVMNSIISNQEILSADDIAGGQVLYGAPGPASPTPAPTPGPPSRLANISTRARVGLGDNLLIGGFIINGTQSKRVLLRAIGPSLISSGVAGPLSDPIIELHGTGGVIGSNDDWQSGSQANEINATGLAPSHHLESALIVTLSSGTYTAIVSGYQNAQGIGLVEAYELDVNGTRLMNISTRGRVAPSGDAMIGGFIVQGGSTKRVIVRALGPSLGTGSNPVAGALGNPNLELRNGSGVLIAGNDDWTGSAQYNEIVASTLPPPNAMESAVIATCGPGNYTAIVQGVNNTSGIGLVEVYDIGQ